jgi:hypothetical protein
VEQAQAAISSGVIYIAYRIFVVVEIDTCVLLPDRTSGLAWWLSRLSSALYAHLMKRWVGAEFDALG